MGSFYVNTVSKVDSSMIGVISCKIDGEKVSLLIACDSGESVKKLLKSISELFAPCDVTLVTFSKHDKKLLVPLLKSQVLVAGGSGSSPANTSVKMVVRELLTKHVRNGVCLAEDIRGSLKAQVSPYGPQRRKAFSGK